MPLSQIPKINYANHPAYGLLFGAPTMSLRIAALKRLLPYLWRYKRLLLRNVNRQINTSLTRELYQNGFKPFRLTEDEIQLILSRVQPYLHEIEEGKKATPLASRTFKNKVISLSQRKEAEFYKEISSILSKRQISEIASSYRGRPMQLAGLCVQAGDKDDPDMKNHFEDIRLSDPASYYFHIDASEGQIKCMIYLHNVTTDTGPTCYVPGSNRNHIGRFELLVRMANDKTRLDKCKRENRELFSALPRIFQKKAEFGNDLNHKDGERFLSQSVELTSDKGNLILFDPNGYHRGKMIKEGKRIVLQVVFAPYG